MSEESKEPNPAWHAADKAIEESGKPNPALRAAAGVIHAAGVEQGWYGSYFTKTYEELEETDPIGFGEFNQIVVEALDAADTTKSWFEHLRHALGRLLHIG